MAEKLPAKNNAAPEYERLVAAAEPPLSSEARSRAWKKTQAALEAVEGRASRQAEHELTQQRCGSPHSGDWLIAGLIGVAALFLFAVLLQAPRLTPSKTPTEVAGDPEEKAEAEDPQPLLERLKSEDFAERRKAFLALLGGGAKTEAKLQTFKSQGDVEQDRQVRELLRGFLMRKKLAEHTDTDSLAFWQTLWELEAETQPHLWAIGVDLEANHSQLAEPPSESLTEVLKITFGADKGTALRHRFTAAFRALKEYQKWVELNDTWAGNYQKPTKAKLLDAVVAERMAVAPVILHTLLEPAIRNQPRTEGEFQPNVLDHMRMIVAAEKLKLHEAVEILVAKFIAVHYESETVQANALVAAWHIEGREGKGPFFPVDLADQTQEVLQETVTWWQEKRIKELLPDLGAEDFSRREAAEKGLLAMGPVIIPILERLPPRNDPEIATRVKNILARLTPKVAVKVGHVLAVKPHLEQVMLSIGQQQGVQPGARFTLRRVDQVVAEVEVQRCYPEMCSAKIVAGTLKMVVGIHDEVFSADGQIMPQANKPVADPVNRSNELKIEEEMRQQAREKELNGQEE